MADKKKHNGRKRGPRKGRNKKNTRPKAILIDTLTHTVRREILRRMHADGRKHYSPSELGEELRMKVPAVDYHVNLMEERAVIQLMKEEKIRGATKHLYTSLVSDNPAVSTILAFTEDEDKEAEVERRTREVEEAETFDNGGAPNGEHRGSPTSVFGRKRLSVNAHLKHLSCIDLWGSDRNTSLVRERSSLELGTTTNSRRAGGTGEKEGTHNGRRGRRPREEYQ
jgi:hypothetical protein